MLQISSLGFPPLEHRQVSLGVTAGMDFFGGGALSTEEVVSLCKADDHSCFLDYYERMYDTLCILNLDCSFAWKQGSRWPETTCLLLFLKFG